MGVDLNDAAEAALNIGPLSRAAAELPDDVRDKIRAVVGTALSPFVTPAGVTPGVACWLVRATAK